MVRLLVDSMSRNATLAGLGTTSTITNYDYEFAETSRNIKCLKLLSVTVPRSYYAIVAGYSSRFEFNYNTTDYAITIPDGTYSGADLVTTMNALIATATSVATLTVTYNAINNKLTFNNASANTWTIYNQITGYSATFPNPGIRQVLGMQSTGAIIMLTGTSATLPLQVNMSIPQYLYFMVKSGSANISAGIVDWEVRRQFVVPMADAPYLGYKSWTVNEEFSQCELFDNQQIRIIHVEWDHGIPDLTAINSSAATVTQVYPLNFNGIDHQLIFET